MRKSVRYALDTVLVTAIIIWLYFVFLIGPDKIIEIIGVKNAYLLIFVAALVSGLTSTAYITLYPAAISLASGGLSPITLALIASAGMTATNMIFFFFGKEGRFVSEAYFKLKSKSEKVHAKLEKTPQWAIPLFFYFYAGFVPLPNAVIIAAAGMFEYPFKKLILPFFLGNATYVSVVIYLGLAGLMALG